MDSNKTRRESYTAQAKYVTETYTKKHGIKANNDLDRCFNNLIVNLRDRPHRYSVDSLGMEMYEELIRQVGMKKIKKLTIQMNTKPISKARRPTGYSKPKGICSYKCYA